MIYPLIPSLTTHHTSTPPSCKMQGCKVARFGATTIFFRFYLELSEIVRIFANENDFVWNKQRS